VITRRWGSADWALVAVLYIAVAAGYLALALTAPPVLTGEEASVSMRDVLFTVEQRTQASVWSTNWTAPVWYWAWSHLDPSYSLFSGRQAKAVALALVAPLVFATLRLRLGCGRPAAVLGGALAVVLPGVVVFGPVATENGLEAVPGLAALLLATSRRWWPLAPVLAGLAVGTYTAGLAWAVAAVLAVLVAVVRQPGRWWQAGLGLTAGGAVVLAPLWWWTAGPERIVVGGGRVDATAGDLGLLDHLLGRDGASYYYFADLPAFGTPVTYGLAVAATVLLVGLRPRSWPWLAAAVATVALWQVGGNMPGTRRVVALTVVGAIALAAGAEQFSWIGATRAQRAALMSTATAVLLAPVVLAVAGWATARPALPVDWPAPPGPTMAAGVAALGEDLRAGRVTLEQVAASTGDSRGAALVVLLAERRGDTAGLPTAAEVAAVPWPAGQG
jgi:hypothetical protein